METPCSRIAHIFRIHNEFRVMPDGTDFVARNFKRIAEVWLDDWKKYLYKTNPKRFENVDAGDLTRPMEIRRKLNCKQFDYFLSYVAPDMRNIFPVPRDDDLAYGTISLSNGTDELCMSDKNVKEKTCRLVVCDKTKNAPQRSQYFHYNPSSGIEHDRSEMCLEKRATKVSGYEYKKNFWTFNFKTHQIVHESSNNCLGVNLDNYRFKLSACNSSDDSQKWNFGYVNETMRNKLNSLF